MSAIAIDALLDKTHVGTCMLVNIRERTLAPLTNTKIDLLGRLVGLPSLSDTYWSA